MESPTLTVTEAAGVLHVTEQTVRLYAQDGRLTARKVGKRWLIARRSLETLLAAETDTAEQAS